MDKALKEIELGKTVRMDGQSAGVYFVSNTQEFWEAVRQFEARQASYTVEVLE